jgi:hypothetical protein
MYARRRGEAGTETNAKQRHRHCRPRECRHQTQDNPVLPRAARSSDRAAESAPTWAVRPATSPINTDGRAPGRASRHDFLRGSSVRRTGKGRPRPAPATSPACQSCRPCLCFARARAAAQAGGHTPDTRHRTRTHGRTATEHHALQRLGRDAKLCRLAAHDRLAGFVNRDL